MAKLAFDELNEFGKDGLLDLIEQSNREFKRKPASSQKRSLPYNEFFGDMLLEPEEIERRMRMAEDLDYVFLFLFAWLAINNGIGDIAYTKLYKEIEQKYGDAIEPYLWSNDSAFEYAARGYMSRQIRHIVDNTEKNLDDAYFFSEDRAEGVAENQTNGVANCEEFFDADANGATTKTWRTMLDNKVRDTHQEMEGVTIPAGEVFTVGDSEMLYPGDDSFGADASELANCRCTVEYGYDEIDLDDYYE